VTYSDFCQVVKYNVKVRGERLSCPCLHHEVVIGGVVVYLHSFLTLVTSTLGKNPLYLSLGD